MLATSNMGDRILRQRQDSLVEINRGWLSQLLTLLEELNDLCFHRPSPTRPSQRVRGHVRHIIEFYECFLDGLQGFHIDYDARPRDSSLEWCRANAAGRVRQLLDRLESTEEIRSDAIVFVRIEDASALQLRDPFVTSSVGRELLALSSHTVHHFALIASILSEHGWTLDANFGVAPSTLRYRQTPGPQLVLKETT